MSKNKIIIKSSKKISTREFADGREIELAFSDLHPIALDALGPDANINRCRISIRVGTRRKLFKVDRVESVTERFPIGDGLFDTFYSDTIYVKPKIRVSTQDV